MFTKFDKTPFLSAVDEFGGPEFLPGLQRADELEVGELAVARFNRLIEDAPDWWTVYEVDVLCIEFLRRHPFFVYGDEFYRADAPPRASLARQRYIEHALRSEGLSVTKVAAQLGVPENVVTLAVNRVDVAQPHHRASIDEFTARRVKRALMTSTVRAVAEQFGLSRAMVGDIRSGKTWYWLDVASAA